MAVTGSPTTGPDGGRGRGVGGRGVLVDVAAAAALLGAVGLYAIRFVAAEHTLYRADQLSYWVYSSRLAADLAADPWAALQSVAWSVAHAELNLLPALPIATAMLVVGDSRLAYVLSVIGLYGSAVVLALLLAVRRSRGGEGVAPRWIVATSVVAAVALLPTLWRPVFIGYLGLGGVALGIVILAVYLADEVDRRSVRALLLLGFLTALLALFRRWYALWSIAFLVVVAVDSVWWAVRERAFDRRGLLAAARAPVIVGLTAAATLLVLAGPVTIARLGPGYGEEFVAYTHHGGLVGRLAAVVREFGLLPLGLLAAAAVLLARRPGRRRTAVLLPLHAVLTWLLMVRVQDHSPHHWYLYLAAALLLAGIGGVALLDRTGGPVAQAGFATAALIVGLVVSAAVYLPGLQPIADAAGPILPRNRVRPAQRSDLDEVRRLLRFLDDRTAARPMGVYVLGNTGTLSEQTLAFANRSLGTDFHSPELILRAAHVDRRDGFPRELLVAGLVLAAEPPQLAMRPEDQQVILLPSESFAEGTGIARAFTRLPEQFLLERRVRVSVFERVRRNTRAEVEELGSRLRECYPDRPDIWRP